MNPRHMEGRLVRAARDAYVELDSQLTSIERDDAGVYHVIASAASFPESEDARWYMKAALHTIILDEFTELRPEEMDVHVIVPHTLPKPPSEVPSNEFLTEKIVAKTDYSLLYLVTIAKSAYVNVVESYPWRDAPAMQAAIPPLIQRIVRNLAEQRTDPALHGNVDAILPPLGGLLNPLDCGVVVKEVTRHLGREPKTLLELYETTFCLARANNPKLAVHALTHMLLA